MGLDGDYKDYVDGIVSSYEQHKDAVDTLINKVNDEGQLNDLILLSLRVKHYIYSRTLEKELAVGFMGEARKIDPDAVEIDAAGIEQETKKHKIQLKKKDSELGDRYAIKISLNAEQMTYVLAIFSSLMLACGYVYTYYFYSHFGFNVSDLFTVSDYLAVSIEKVHTSFVSAVISIVIGFWWISGQSRSSKEQLERERHKMRFIPYLIGISILGLNVQAVIIGEPLWSTAVFCDVLLLSGFFGPDIAKKYFKKPLIALFMILFIANWGSQLYSTITKDIYAVENGLEGHVRRCGGFTFVKDVDIAYDACELAMIGANSSYAFFVAMDYEKSIALPKQAVSRFENTLPEPGENWFVGLVKPFMVIWDTATSETNQGTDKVSGELSDD
ncbi:hypothetical protein GCM10011332_30720 [Terasakiella brassicae]|uniref:Uncharacterized protein n=2 Tax=Terasakiella brassicae TaxID=1634917 RepID=A0A917FEV9_9PROT|nr:hypothetical protein GCM10011332_30720 [Terasakiella brassicae]